ncbi:MAG: sterol desaturase family protein [Spirochaetes bacterium]|nr:sterol desaturase family protein [Spirochaetota bacterium]
MLNFPEIIKITGVFIIYDAWMYIWHRMNHEIYFLWRFHRVHHTDTSINYSTIQRYHIVETIYTILIKTMVLLILGISPAHYFIYEVTLNFIAMFHHSNIRLNNRIDHILKYLIVTPNMHRTHHEINYFDSNSNYSSIFSVWDRIFKTFRIKKDYDKIKFGQDRFLDKKWNKLEFIFITPFLEKKVIKKGKKFLLIKKNTGKN